MNQELVDGRAGRRLQMEQAINRGQEGKRTRGKGKPHQDSDDEGMASLEAF
jgi:hypothetical protein